MRRILLFFFSLFIISCLSAQDTTIVQTFTWDNDARSGFFEFPDAPDATYEKIIMRYNMRCHDNAVGSGNVGCREWDYSCNTFITDPTRTDSFRRTHPTHVIPGFTGEVFPYVNETYHNYIEFNQTLTTINENDLSFHSIGSGTLPYSALNTQEKSRTQYLYFAEDLTAAGLSAGPIHAIQLEHTEGIGEIPFLRFRIKNVDREGLDDGTFDINGFTDVYFQSTTFDQLGWVTIPFHTPFDWDGVSDILLDQSHNGVGTAPNIEFSAHNTPQHTGASPNSTAAHYLGLQGAGWMEVPTEALGMDQQITIAFWSFGAANDLPANTSVLEGMDENNNRQLNVHLPWSNSRIYWDCGNDGTGYDRIDKAANVEDFEGQWNHWAFTKNATTGDMAIYLNGELWHSGTDKFRPIDANDLVFGRNSTSSNPYPGDLNNISIWQQALTAEEIQQIMHTENIPTQHPAYDALVAHYPLNEGTGLTATDATGNGFEATLTSPNWRNFRGKDLQQNWATIPGRYNVQWSQGNTSPDNTTTTALDSFLVGTNTVLAYEVDPSNSLQLTSTFEAYPAEAIFVYNEAGDIINLFDLEADGEIEIGTLEYHQKRDAKFELLSLVTPYGNGLSLGAEGKTFYFDVTDFTPVLRGERFLSMEMGGQNQEEMDVQFWFISGTPTRDVMDISNVWPFARGWYEPIQNDDVFEPRMIDLNLEADIHKLRASVTGHGQNGEFVPREHFLNINGGSQEFQFDVWKECGENPIYPQGGTWIFDRAGWCPGAATDVHEYFLPQGTGASSVEIDYGVNGAFMSEANYLVSTQMVTYGEANFNQDVALEAVIRPSKRVEYERFNPACNTPTVLIKNNGTQDVNSVSFNYNVSGGAMESYEWTGNLAFLETMEVELPIPYFHFWDTDDENPVFTVEITAMNGSSDEYADNNIMESPFTPARVFEEADMLIQLKTNNRPQENRYTIKDGAGNVVLERDNMAVSTTYRDDILLPAGCYTLRLEDDGDDGLDFWYWAAVGQNVGTGNVGFRRRVNGGSIVLPVLTLEPDNGDGIQFDFIIPLSTPNENLENPQRLSVYPNPAHTSTTIELTGFAGEQGTWQLIDANGKVHQTKAFEASGKEHFETIDLMNFPSGYYVVRIVTADRTFSRELVIVK